MTRALLVAPLFLLLACPPPDAAQRALSVTARALVEVDEAAAPAYGSAHAEALEESETREEYAAMMEPWNRLEEGLRLARVALLSAQESLDAWQSTSEAASFRTALPGLVGALRGVLLHLGAVGVEAPEGIDQALALIGALLEVQE